MMAHLHVHRMREGDVVNSNSTELSLSSVESHMIHTLILMVIALFVCWVSNVILYFLSFAEITVSPTTDTICALCLFGVNLLLYVIRQKDFQRGFRQVIKRISRLQFGTQ